MIERRIEGLGGRVVGEAQDVATADAVLNDWQVKSPALAEALRPLQRLVTDAHARYEEGMLAHHFRLAEGKARRHALAR